MSAILAKLQYWGLLLLIFLVPLFFLPATADFFELNKLMLASFGLLLLASVWAVKSFLERKLVLVMSPLDLAVFVFAALALVSAVVRTPNKTEAFLVPGTATAILSASLLYFVVTQTVRSTQHTIRSVVYALLASGIVVALVSIAAGTGILEQIPNLPAFAKVRTFSLLGAVIPTLTFLSVVFVLGIGEALRLFRSERNKGNATSAMFIAYCVFIVAAAAAVLFHATPGKPGSPKFLPIGSGWAIAVDTLKTSPFGVGPGNFLTAFNQVRPASYNLTDSWNLRYAVSSNWYLSVFTEVGILGLLGFAFLVWRVLVALWRESEGKSVAFAVFIVFIILLAVPANFTLLATLYVLLGLLGVVHGRERTASFVAEDLSGGRRSTLPIAPGLAILLIVGGSVVLAIFGGRAYGAEIFYKRALDAAARNDGQGLISNLNQAINLNPEVDRYHTVASQAALAVANGIASRGSSGSITDQDRQNISQAIQDAIKQAQIAVSLNRERSNNWEFLGSVYRSLITVAQGADQFAILTYNQAIALEPVNPILRLNLGGIHYQAGRFDDAIKSFELAVAAKSDWANAHYNLAVALRDKGDLQRAVAEMEQTLALVQPGTKDYETAQSELESLRSKLPPPSQRPSGPAVSQQGETLAAPSQSPAPVVKPPIELPEEAGPPSTEGGQ